MGTGAEGVANDPVNMGFQVCQYHKSQRALIQNRLCDTNRKCESDGMKGDHKDKSPNSQRPWASCTQ
jgi:hypothetical protein